MEVLVEEEDSLYLSPIDALVDEQANKLFDLCDMNEKGYVVHKDLNQLGEFIPNFSANDLEILYREAADRDSLSINRENFVRAISEYNEPFLLKQKSITRQRSKKKPIKDVSKKMFRTISLDNDETKIQPKSTTSNGNQAAMRHPKLSISLDEKLGNSGFLNSRNPASIPKDLGNYEQSSEGRPSLDSDDYDSIPISSPYFDRSFSLQDDAAPVTAKKKLEEHDKEIEKKNHDEIKEVVKKSKSSLELRQSTIERPCDFGPTSLLSHPILADDVKTPDRIFKVVFVGDSAVGKTCFLHRFCHNRFKPLFNATIGVDFTVKNIKVVDRIVAVQLWDTAGQERFRSITKQYFRKADSVVLMYDVTSEQSFLNVRNWINSVRMGVGDGCVMCLVGNKVDLTANEVERKVSYDDGKRIAEEFDMLFFETSAYSGLGINDCMKAVAIRLQQREDDQLEEALKLEMIIQSSKKSWCCL